MKILLVSNFFPPHFIGGAEIIAHRQAKALLARGHDVHVLAGDNSRPVPGYAATAEVFDGMTVTRVALQPSDFAPTGNNLAHPQVDRLFEALLDEWQPDVIHAHHLVGLSLGILQIARARGVRIALTLHDHWGFCINSIRMTTANQLCVDATRCDECHASIHVDGLKLPQRMRQDYLRWQLQAVDHFISPSHYLAQAYVASGIEPQRMHVIANGIELEPYAASRQPPFVERLRVLFVGYMGEHKGVPTLLRALAMLPHDRLHVDFIGDGHQRLVYQQELQRSAPQLSHRFWGRLPNALIAERMASAHVFVLPSICPENQPVTITEAMASGMPVIASRIGGIPELVEHDDNGLLFEPGNAKDLALQLERYLAAPEKLKVHGQAGRERIKRYLFALQIERLEALLASDSSTPFAPPLTLVACYGSLDSTTYRAVLDEIAPAPPGKPQPQTQPCIVPAHWFRPSDATLLWVAGVAADNLPAAQVLIERYLEAGRVVLLDERNLSLARQLDGHPGVMIARGREQLVMALSVLLKLRAGTPALVRSGVA